jgi:Galactose oxidase, central domain
VQIADTGPPPRAAHAMAYDSDKSRIILFGGGNTTSFMDDTWEWDGTEWTQVADTGPSARAYHSMVYESSKIAVLLFGVSILTYLGIHGE